MSKSYYIVPTDRFQSFVNDLTAIPTQQAVKETIFEIAKNDGIPDCGFTVFEMTNVVGKGKPRVVQTGVVIESTRKTGPRGPRKPKTETTEATSNVEGAPEPKKRGRKSQQNSDASPASI